jgi:ATP-binding cassette subfamily B (MDR/TAP) protein 1
LFYVYLAVVVFVLIYASTVGFYYTGEKIARSLRHEYLKSVLRQNIAYFDVLGTGEVSSRIMSDMGVIQEGVSHKLSLAITAIATFGSALVISFVMYWKTALIMSPTYIVMLIIGTIAGRQAIKFLKVSREYKSNGASIAEETITSVRQVAAYGMANFLSDKYDGYLKDGEVSGIKSRNSFAAYAAWCNAMPSLVYGLSFWAGSIYLVKAEISVAGVTTTALTISVGTFAIVRVAPCFEALFASITSADAVLKTIGIRSPQDPFETSGTRLNELKGDISFQDVSLIYPSRDDVLVLDKVQISIPAAGTTAIVGSSGCGKSSVIALLERFYEPISGQISKRWSYFRFLHLLIDGSNRWT